MTKFTIVTMAAKGSAPKDEDVMIVSGPGGTITTSFEYDGIDRLVKVTGTLVCKKRSTTPNSYQ